MTGLQLQEQDRINFIEELATTIVRSKERGELESIVWDITFSELLEKDWEDVLDFAEEFGVRYS